MGLTIHFNFSALRADAAEAERLVRALHEQAQSLAFDSVSDVYHELDPDHTDEFGALYPGRRTVRTGRDRVGRDESPIDTAPSEPMTDEEIEAAAEEFFDDFEARNERVRQGLEPEPGIEAIHNEWAATLIDATDGGWLDLHPRETWFFWCNNAGCDPLLVGLSRYPAVVEHTVKGVPDTFETGLGVGWHWEGFCKTQYASVPQPDGPGGDKHFLKSHDAVIRLLDHAQTLGLSVTVQDEGDYWTHRDPDRLLKTVRDWNAMVARFGGRLKDDGVNTQGPIFDHPEFEHLEAEGEDAIARFRKRLQQSDDEDS